MADEVIVKVWDVPTRLFHWTLVISFAAAYLTAEFHFGYFHSLIGYFLCFLLLARLVLGFTGNQYARFKSFIFSPQETKEYFRAILNNNPRHYLGHNPAGALMVFALLGLLFTILLSGLITLAAIDYDGPLLFLANLLSDEASYAFRYLHSWLINFAFVLISLHLIGVVAGSVQHKENLVRAMITGIKKQGPTENQDQRN
jgi:cytochrome b